MLVRRFSVLSSSESIGVEGSSVKTGYISVRDLGASSGLFSSSANEWKLRSVVLWKNSSGITLRIYKKGNSYSEVSDSNIKLTVSVPTSAIVKTSNKREGASSFQFSLSTSPEVLFGFTDKEERDSWVKSINDIVSSFIGSKKVVVPTQAELSTEAKPQHDREEATTSSDSKNIPQPQSTISAREEVKSVAENVAEISGEIKLAIGKSEISIADSMQSSIPVPTTVSSESRGVNVSGISNSTSIIGRPNGVSNRSAVGKLFNEAGTVVAGSDQNADNSLIIEAGTSEESLKDISEIFSQDVPMNRFTSGSVASFTPKPARVRLPSSAQSEDKFSRYISADLNEALDLSLPVAVGMDNAALNSSSAPTLNLNVPLPSALNASRDHGRNGPIILSNSITIGSSRVPLRRQQNREVSSSVGLIANVNTLLNDEKLPLDFPVPIAHPIIGNSSNVTSAATNSAEPSVREAQALKSLNDQYLKQLNEKNIEIGECKLQYSRQIESLQAELQQLKLQKNGLSNINKQLTEDLTEKDAQIIVLLKVKAELMAEIEEVNCRMEEAQNESILMHMERDLVVDPQNMQEITVIRAQKSQIDDIMHENEELSKKMQNLESIVTDQLKTIQQLNRTINNKERELENYIHLCKEYSDSVVKANKRADESESNLNSLEDRLHREIMEEMSMEVRKTDGMEIKIKTLETELALQRSEANKYLSKISELDPLLLSKDKLISELNEQLEFCKNIYKSAKPENNNSEIISKLETKIKFYDNLLVQEKDFAVALRDELSNLRSENAALTSDLGTTKDECNRKVSKLENELEIKDVEISRLTQRNESLKNAANSLEKQLVNLQNQIQTQKCSYEGVISELQFELETVRRSFNEVEEKNLSAEFVKNSEVGRLKSRIAHLESSVEGYRDKYSKIESEHQKVKIYSSQIEWELNDLKSESSLHNAKMDSIIKENTAERDILKSSLQTLQSTNAKLELELSELRRNISSGSEKLQESIDTKYVPEIKKLSQNVIMLETNNNFLQQKLIAFNDEKSAEVFGLNDRINSLLTTIESINTQNLEREKALQLKLIERSSVIDNLRTENQGLKLELSAKQELFETMELETISLRDENLKFAENLEKELLKVEPAFQELKSKNAVIQRLNTEKDEYRLKSESLTNELETMKGYVESLENASVVDYEAVVGSLNETIDQTSRKYSEKVKEFKDLQGQFDKVSKEYIQAEKSYRDELDLLKIELKEAKLLSDQLQLELENGKKSISNYEAKLKDSIGVLEHTEMIEHSENRLKELLSSSDDQIAVLVKQKDDLSNKLDAYVKDNNRIVEELNSLRFLFQVDSNDSNYTALDQIVKLIERFTFLSESLETINAEISSTVQTWRKYFKTANCNGANGAKSINDLLSSVSSGVHELRNLLELSAKTIDNDKVELHSTFNRQMIELNNEISKLSEEKHVYLRENFELRAELTSLNMRSRTFCEEMNLLRAKLNASEAKISTDGHGWQTKLVEAEFRIEDMQKKHLDSLHSLEDKISEWRERFNCLENEKRLVSAALEAKSAKLAEVDEDKEAIKEVWNKRVEAQKNQNMLLSSQLIEENKRIAAILCENRDLKVKLLHLSKNVKPVSELLSVKPKDSYFGSSVLQLFPKIPEEDACKNISKMQSENKDLTCESNDKLNDSWTDLYDENDENIAKSSVKEIEIENNPPNPVKSISPSKSVDRWTRATEGYLSSSNL